MKQWVLNIAIIVFLLITLFGGLTWIGDRIQPIEKNLVLTGPTLTTGLRNLLLHLASASDLIQERDALEVENERLKKLNTELELLSKENSELRKFVNFRIEKKISIAVARVYGFQIPGPHKGYFDAGSQDGVQNGQWVFENSGGIVGQISDVRETVSIVTFLSSPEISVQAFSRSSNEVIGVTQGGNHAEVILGLVPKHIRLQAGAHIFSAIEGTRSMEFLIGTVESVSSKPSDLFQTALVSLSVPFSKITYGAVFSERR